MRKIIISAITLLILILVFGPLAAGFYFKKNYIDLLAFYNTQKNFHVAINDYQRGWWSSKIFLTVTINNAELNPILNVLGLSSENKKIMFIVEQQVEHGPIIYSSRENLPSHFGLAVIKNKILSEPENFMRSYSNFVNFSGDFFHHIEIAHFKIKDATSNLSIKLDNILANFWIQPKLKNMYGKIAIGNFMMIDADDSLVVNKIYFILDQQGFAEINIGKITMQELNEELLFVKDIMLSGSTQKTVKNLSEVNQLDIQQIKINDQLIGPLHVQLSINNLNAEKLNDLIRIAQDGFFYDENYSGQTRQRIATALPQLINPQTTIKLDDFNLATANGALQMQGGVDWTVKDFFSLGNIRDVIMAANAQLKLHINKKLLNDLINFVASSPDTIRDVAAPDRSVLLNVRDQMTFAAQQNKIFIATLVENEVITKKMADDFLAMQDQLVPLDDYAVYIKDLLLTRKIALGISYLLSWQYAQLQQPYQFLEKKVADYQKDAYNQLQRQFNDLLKKGYVIEEKNNYSTLFVWSDGKLKINNHLVE